MKPSNHKPRSWVVTTLLSAAAIAYVVFVFLPGQRAIGGMRKQLHEKQEFIVQADRLAFAISRASTDLQSAIEYAEAWRTAAPAEAKLAATFGRITERAQLAGLAVHRFDPQPLVKLDSVWQAPINLVGEGDFQQICEFLRLVETMPGAVWVQNLRMESGDKGEGRLRCEVTLIVFADNRDFSE
jgi:Tfp pilus assembly protein PilO